MSSVSGKKSNYEINVYVRNEKNNKWEKTSTKIGAKTAQFIENAGDLELFKTAKPGDVLEFTEKGVFKKTEKGWVSALTPQEIKNKMPEVRKVIKVASNRIMGAFKESSESTKEVPEDFITNVVDKEKWWDSKTQVILEIKILEEKPQDLSSLVQQINVSNPDLANQLIQKNNEYLLQKEKYEAYLQSNPDDPFAGFELLKVKDAAKNELDLLIQAAKTANYSEKKISALAQPPEPKFIAKGKAKEVYAKGNSPYVYLVPVQDIFSSVINLKEAEIKEEVATAKRIADNLKGSPKKPDSHLAIELEVVKEEEKVKGRYTVRTPKAMYDLEKEFQVGDNGVENKAKFGSGFLNGMKDLHDSGHVHGDLKPENVLVYNKETDPTKSPQKDVKVSDFGKTRTIKENEKLMYTGNPRFAAPERKLSKKSEVYSSALILIRILEEGLLDDATGMIKQPSVVDNSNKPDERRRGVEKFVIMSKHLPQLEANTLRGKVRMLTSGAQRTLTSSAQRELELANAESEIHGYIDVLTAKLESKENIPHEKTILLNELLKEMTLSDPDKRPTLSNATIRYDAIGLDAIGLPPTT